MISSSQWSDEDEGETSLTTGKSHSSVAEEPKKGRLPVGEPFFDQITGTFRMHTRAVGPEATRYQSLGEDNFETNRANPRFEELQTPSSQLLVPTVRDDERNVNPRPRQRSDFERDQDQRARVASGIVENQFMVGDKTQRQRAPQGPVPQTQLVALPVATEDRTRQGPGQIFGTNEEERDPQSLQERLAVPLLQGLSDERSRRQDPDIGKMSAVSTGGRPHHQDVRSQRFLVHGTGGSESSNRGNIAHRVGDRSASDADPRATQRELPRASRNLEGVARTSFVGDVAARDACPLAARRETPVTNDSQVSRRMGEVQATTSSPLTGALLSKQDSAGMQDRLAPQRSKHAVHAEVGATHPSMATTRSLTSDYSSLRAPPMLDRASPFPVGSLLRTTRLIGRAANTTPNLRKGMAAETIAAARNTRESWGASRPAATTQARPEADAHTLGSARNTHESWGASRPAAPTQTRPKADAGSLGAAAQRPKQAPTAVLDDQVRCPAGISDANVVVDGNIARSYSSLGTTDDRTQRSYSQQGGGEDSSVAAAVLQRPFDFANERTAENVPIGRESAGGNTGVALARSKCVDAPNESSRRTVRFAPSTTLAPSTAAYRHIAASEALTYDHSAPSLGWNVQSDIASTAAIQRPKHGSTPRGPTDLLNIPSMSEAGIAVAGSAVRRFSDRKLETLLQPAANNPSHPVAGVEKYPLAERHKDFLESIPNRRGGEGVPEERLLTEEEHLTHDREKNPQASRSRDISVPTARLFTLL
jgi:hypothetical protein